MTSLAIFNQIYNSYLKKVWKIETGLVSLLILRTAEGFFRWLKRKRISCN